MTIRARDGKTLLLVACISMGVGGTGCATVGPGRVGVLWRASGGTQPQTYGEGLYAVAPWNDLSVYDLRSMSHDEIPLLEVITVNGLGIKLDASVRYHLNPNEVVPLQREIGPEYCSKILEPVLRSEARRVFGRYTPEEIYSTKREIVEREIREGLAAKIEGKHIVLEAILIRDVELPEAIRKAIDQKLAAEQEVLKMKYVLEVEQSDCRRSASTCARYRRLQPHHRDQPDAPHPRIRTHSGAQQTGRLRPTRRRSGSSAQRAGDAPVLLSTPTGSPTGSR